MQISLSLKATNVVKEKRQENEDEIKIRRNK